MSTLDSPTYSSDSEELGSPAASSGLALPEGVLPFVRKAFEILSDASFASIISWSPAGTSFVVHDTTDFSDTVLPRYFKHRNFCSFVRQLNTYGFAKADTKTWEFQHELFRRDAPEALVLIKRRKPAKRAPAPGSSASPPRSAAYTELLAGGPYSGLPSAYSPSPSPPPASVTSSSPPPSSTSTVPTGPPGSSSSEALAAAAAAAAAAGARAEALAARVEALEGTLGRYQALCSSLVSQVSAGSLTFPSPADEKAFLSGLVSVLFDPAAPAAGPSSPPTPLSPEASSSSPPSSSHQVPRGSPPTSALLSLDALPASTSSVARPCSPPAVPSSPLSSGGAFSPSAASSASSPHLTTEGGLALGALSPLAGLEEFGNGEVFDVSKLLLGPMEADFLPALNTGAPASSPDSVW